MRLILKLLINSLALWLTTIIVAGVAVSPFPPGGTLETVLTALVPFLWPALAAAKAPAEFRMAWMPPVGPWAHIFA